MIHIALRDLIWRRRRYAVSVIGTALVFAVGMVVTGISDAFPAELHDSFDSLRAPAFVVPEGVSGPLTGIQPFDVSELPPDIEPMAYLVQTANPSDPHMVATIGLTPGDAEPVLASGSHLDGPDQALVDDASPFPTGSIVEISGRAFTVVGRIAGLSVNAGMPGVVIPLRSFQDQLLGGLPLATAGIARDVRVDAPSGFHVVTREAATEDTLRILGDAASTIDLVKVLLWVVAALIVGSVMFLSAVERTRDFAVLKAIGVGDPSMAGGIALQAAVLSLTAALLGEAGAFALAPFFPMKVVMSPTAMIGLPLLALAVGLASAAFALRHALRTEPALAFGAAS